jgi:hypothetical protein
MSKDRFKRILIVVFVVFLVLVGAKVFADWQGEKRTQGEVLSLPTKEISEKINDFGEQILGKAIEVLPGGTEIKEKIESQPEPFSQVEEMIQETKPEEKVENKTQEIIEIIKQLPAEQLEIIKKQIFEDFCREILKE